MPTTTLEKNTEKKKEFLEKRLSNMPSDYTKTD
jgi:hypothetical protein